MEKLNIFWLAGLCLALCAVNSRTQRIFDKFDENNEFANVEDDREWKNKDTENYRLGQMNPKRGTTSTRRAIDANKTGCSKYCIQKRISEDIGIDTLKRVNIIWKIVDDARVTFIGDTTNSWGLARSSAQNKDHRWEFSKMSLGRPGSFIPLNPRCELYLELGCDIYSKLNIAPITFPEEGENYGKNKKKLVSMNLIDGYTETEFNVDESTDDLEIQVSGKISQAVLEIPIAPRTGDAIETRTLRPTLSLSRATDAKGVRLDAHNPPSGEWRLQLFGVENSNYSLRIVAISINKNEQETDVERERDESSLMKEGAARYEDEEAINVNPNEKLSMKLPADRRPNDENTEPLAIKSNDEQMNAPELLPVAHPIDTSETLESSASKHFVERIDVSESDEMKSVPKLSKNINLEDERIDLQVQEKIVSAVSSVESSQEMAKIFENSELDELSRGTKGIQRCRKGTVMDISPKTELIARPGIFVIIFTVTNNHPIDIRHIFRARSTQFPVVNVYPIEWWIKAGGTISVAVGIQVPDIQDTKPGIVTLRAEVSENFAVVEKSTYVYTQGSTGVEKTDNDKPNIDYFFNDNCAGKLQRDRCHKSMWSVEITTNDPNSGLKRVTSLPVGIESQTEFIAGTKNDVEFYYMSTCCYTTVEVTATDVQGNIHVRKIDVTEWDNLSQGEIAAIVVGALLILLLIILIILIIIYCIRKRRSHDLSYSQRYGSRTPASAERTNF